MVTLKFLKIARSSMLAVGMTGKSFARVKPQSLRFLELSLEVLPRLEHPLHPPSYLLPS